LFEPSAAGHANSAKIHVRANMAKYRLVSFKAGTWVQRVVMVEKEIECDFQHIA
jgi:hypothetical protein